MQIVPWYICLYWFSFFKDKDTSNFLLKYLHIKNDFISLSRSPWAQFPPKT